MPAATTLLATLLAAGRLLAPPAWVADNGEVTIDEQRQLKWRRVWEANAAAYDRQMGFFDATLFRGCRAWVCSRATGETLEVGFGTGLNLPFYRTDAQLTGLDLSMPMLAIAATRAARLARPVRIVTANAHALPFADACFDTVTATFALCAIPDDRQAVAEMVRVLRPGGMLLLADHVRGYPPLRPLQWLLDAFTVRSAGEHFSRRPLELVHRSGLLVERRDRRRLGIVERVAARKPGPMPDSAD